MTEENNPIYFYKKAKKFYEFSNFYYPIKLKIGGLEYPTSEHYYQSQKYCGSEVNSQDLEYAEIIRTCATPREAFNLGKMKPGDKRVTEAKKKGVKINPEWDLIKDDVMFVAVMHKFEQNPELKELLLSTGNCEIYEDSPYDSYWGIGKNRDGKNMLGKTLMKVREIMREKNE